MLSPAIYVQRSQWVFLNTLWKRLCHNGPKIFLAMCLGTAYERRHPLNKLGFWSFCRYHQTRLWCLKIRNTEHGSGRERLKAFRMSERSFYPRPSGSARSVRPSGYCWDAIERFNMLESNQDSISRSHMAFSSADQFPCSPKLEESRVLCPALFSLLPFWQILTEAAVRTMKERFSYCFYCIRTYTWKNMFLGKAFCSWSRWNCMHHSQDTAWFTYHQTILSSCF